MTAVGRPPAVAPGLPVAITSFVGRRREITAVRAALARSRLVTLTGVGGVGKTRLALQVGSESRRTFTDGVWLVDLAPVTDGSRVPQAVATALAIRDQSTRPALDQVIEHLADRRALLLLDNCEHVVADAAAIADRLVRRCPGLRLLATSRRTLGIDGEHVVAVPPLSLPLPGADLPMAALTAYEAVSLLCDRAAAAVPGFALADAERDAVVGLCTRLDGIPLAIELAAVRLRTLSLRQLTERLDDRFAVLNAGSRVAAPRQRTLRALVDWSYDLCSPQERLGWARLSVFSGGFDLEAAEAVCCGDGLDPSRVLDVVDHLVVQSIVRRVHAGPVPRFTMLETIREYGVARLAELDEADGPRRRHREHFLAVARHGARTWSGPGQEATLARLRADHANLRATFDDLRADPAGVDEAVELAAALCWHWCADGFLSEGRRWLDQALALPTGAASGRAEALWVCAWVALLQGDGAAADARLAECEAIVDRSGDVRNAAYAESFRGSAELFRGDVAAAVDHFRRATAELTRLDDPGGAAFALFQLSVALAHLGDLDGAEASARRAMALSEAQEEHLGRSYASWALAFVLWSRGEVDQARRAVLDGLRIQAGFRDSVGAALMIELLAWAALTAGDAARAALLLGTAHSVWRSIGTGIAAFGPQLAEHHDRCEAEARRALRGRGFDAAFGRGLRPTVEAAIACAVDRTPPTEHRITDPAPVALTRRERQVAELVAKGLTNRAIAERLVLSPRTVDGHLESILTKLAFTSRTQIAAWLAGRDD